MNPHANITTFSSPMMRCLHRFMGMSVVTCVALLLVAAASADTITVHDRSAIRAAAVTLGDVADLDGPVAVALADVPLGEIGAAGSRTFTLADIRTALDARNVHWGKLNLRGPTRLTVSRITADLPGKSDPSAAANPIAAIDTAAAPALGTTLGQFIIARVQQRAGRSADDKALQITPLNANDPAWKFTDAEYRFEIEPAARQALGRIPFNIRCYKDGQLDGVQHLSVDVAVRAKVVVAARQIQRGQIIVPDDLTTQTLDLDDDRIQPVADPKPLVGQAATRLIRSGTVISTGDIAPRVLVERGQLVSVRATSGGIVVKFTARAAADGAAGDTIEVRTPRTRETYTVRVTGPQETEMLINGSADDATGDTTAQSPRSLAVGPEANP